jgi:PAS domain S-box-containing protein
MLERMNWDFHIVLANIPAVLFRGYADGSIDLFDRKVEALIGYPQASFGQQGMKWMDLIWEEDREATRRAFIQALKTNRAYVREYRVRSVSGRAVWAQCRDQPAWSDG